MPTGKLTTFQAAEVKWWKGKGVPARLIGRFYGVTIQTVRSIWRGDTWVEVQPRQPSVFTIEGLRELK